MPSTWFQSFNPLMIFTFAPILNILWAWQARKKKEPSSVVKMAIGCFLLGLSFIILIIAVQGEHVHRQPDKLGTRPIVRHVADFPVLPAF